MGISHAYLDRRLFLSWCTDGPLSFSHGEIRPMSRQFVFTQKVLTYRYGCVVSGNITPTMSKDNNDCELLEICALSTPIHAGDHSEVLRLGGICIIWNVTSGLDGKSGFGSVDPIAPVLDFHIPEGN